MQELKKLVEDQRLAMEGMRKELAEVSAKAQAAVKRKMAGVPPLCKPELLKVRDLDSKPQWGAAEGDVVARSHEGQSSGSKGTAVCTRQSLGGPKCPLSF